MERWMLWAPFIALMLGGCGRPDSAVTIAYSSRAERYIADERGLLTPAPPPRRLGAGPWAGDRR